MSGTIILKSLCKQEARRGTIVWLHGLGDSGEGYRSLFKDIICPKFNFTMRVVLPSAPERPVSINNGMIMPSWYDIKSLGSSDLRERKDFDEQGISDSQRLIEEILERETLEMSSNRVILGGFSQGGVLASLCGLQYKKTLGGIVSFSGYVSNKLMKEGINENNRRTPFLVYHGSRDSMVPLDSARWTYNQLKTLYDVQYEFVEAPNQDHEITDQQLEYLIDWISKTLPESKL